MYPGVGRTHSGACALRPHVVERETRPRRSSGCSSLGRLCPGKSRPGRGRLRPRSSSPVFFQPQRRGIRGIAGGIPAQSSLPTAGHSKADQGEEKQAHATTPRSPKAVDSPSYWPYAGLTELHAPPERVPIETDVDGVTRVGGTRVTLDTLLAAFDFGATAEEIAQQHDSVTLADVYWRFP